MRRVVITGMGAVTPIGNTVTDMWDSMIHGKHGIEAITHYDEIETLAIKRALGEKLAYKAVVSSTKSMTGHLLGGAGAVEAIVCILVLQTGCIPPTIGYRIPDTACDLDICPNEVREAKVDLALSNSLGFGGHNSCLAFKEV
ncbi:MAG: beta-ketoacyl synthase N-terminal-like domain-containing protein [Ruminococcus sp.]